LGRERPPSGPHKAVNMVHTRRRSRVYYFRARVPSDLVPVLRRRELIRSLKTKDRRIAELKSNDLRGRSLRLAKFADQ
jgi:hypothetical protein